MEAFVSVGDAKERGFFFPSLSVRLRNDTRERERELSLEQEETVSMKTFCFVPFVEKKETK